MRTKTITNLGAKFVEIKGPNGLALFVGGLASSASGLASSDGRMKPVCWRREPVRQPMKPVLLVLIYSFHYFFKIFFLSSKSLTIRINIKKRPQTANNRPSRTCIKYNKKQSINKNEREQTRTNENE